METLPDYIQQEIQDDTTRARAADIAAELKATAIDAVTGAQAAARVEANDRFNSELGDNISMRRAEKLGDGVLRVADTLTTSPPFDSEGDLTTLLDGSEPTVYRNGSSTTTVDVNKHGFSGRRSNAPLPAGQGRTSGISVTEHSTDKPAEVSFKEINNNGTRRNVERFVNVDKDENGKDVIRVKQISTDKDGNNMRERRWVHTELNPSPVATEIANTVGKRVAAKQPKPTEQNISM